MAKLSSRQFAQALYLAISETHPRHHDKVIDNFAEVLKEEGALHLVDEIEQEFVRHEKEAQGIKTAEVVSAHKLDPDEERKLVKELNDYVGGNVELKKKVDENLLGGIMVRLGDEVIDNSLKRRLTELKDKLIK